MLQHSTSTCCSAQLKWLQSTLGNVDRSATPFLIVSMHRPMYVDSDYGYNVPTGDVNVSAASLEETAAGAESLCPPSSRPCLFRL